jgi:hypothetical protein
MVDYNIFGVQELNDGLKALEPRKQINAIRNAAREAMKPTLQDARSRIPRGTEMHKTYKGRWVSPGFAARNLNINTYRYKQFLIAGATLGTQKEAFYARAFLEKGVPSRNIAPQPWLRPSYEANRRNMERIFAQALRQKIIDQAKKIKKPKGMKAAEARQILGRAA